MHDGGGGGFGGGHMGGHVGGHVGGHAGGHPVNPAHHHQHAQAGTNGPTDMSPGYLAATGLRGRGGPGFQRVAPALGVIGIIVILFVVLLVI